MGLIRLLLVAALIWLVWRVLRQTLLGAPREGGKTHNQPPQSQKMVRCDWCQVHTPESQTVRLQEHHFCSEDHRQQWLEKHHD
ncbi:MAG: PP0621 family protein [Alcanivoracaceae bacterium]|nr:PP0621 family protein [Alcanivoracaceae bacterium]